MSELEAPRLSYSEIQKLTRWSTPSVFNGWEAVTGHERTEPWYNIEETGDFMPHMGPMAGYAVTVVAEPSNPAHPRANPDAWAEYRAYVAGIPGPKIVVVQDLDKPNFVGAFWGEVTSNVHRALGCVGTIIDGAIRDVDEMAATGFKAIAGRLCVGHAYSMPVRWGCDVEVFGCPVKPGFLIHADKHGFLVIPPEDEPKLLEAVAFMDANECNTVIAAAKGAPGKSVCEILESLEEADDAFARAVEENFPRENFTKKGEWGKK
ncbi:MAG TPA: RraA family protein [Spirochaetia bacterium]|nr:RraA family protein [Spirochaetia bacterium]